MSTRAIVFAGLAVFVGAGVLLAYLMFAVAQPRAGRDDVAVVDAGPIDRRLPAQPRPLPAPTAP